MLPTRRPYQRRPGRRCPGTAIGTSSRRTALTRLTSPIRCSLRTVFVALTLVALVVTPVVPARADDQEHSRLEQLAREKAELERAVQVSRQKAARYQQVANRFQSAVDAANTRIADLAAEQAQAQTTADVLRLRIAIAEEQLALVGLQLEETQSLITSLNAQASQQERQLRVREQMYATQLRTVYRDAQVSPLEMLLSSRSLTHFAERLQASLLVGRQNQQLVTDIRALRASTLEKRAQVAEREQEIVGLQMQIETQRAGLTKEKADYEDLVRVVQASIDQQTVERGNAAADRNNALRARQQASDETARLNRQLERTEAAYAALAADLARRSNLGAFSGRMATWPLGGPITSRFGPRWGGFHNGLDIAGPMYTPVRAAAAGQVVTAGRPYVAFGDTAVVVIVAHGSNFSTLYGHLDDSRSLPVRVGQFVAAGTVLGYVGMTGWTTGPHVHFMTIVDGRAVDPIPYMP